MKLDLNRFNERVKNWGNQASRDMRTEGESLGIEHRENSPSNGASLPKINAGFRQRDGAVAVISFRLRRSLIYPHKGAGKGRGGSKGSKWVDKYGNTKKTNSKSFGKMGTDGRKAKPFINNVLERESGVEQLAFIAASETGDAIVNNMLVK